MKKVRISHVFILIAIGIVSLSLGGCMRYLTHDRAKVLLEGVDIDQTLKIAAVKMKQQQGKLGVALPIWVIRDQKITPSQAQEISRLYFANVSSIREKFDIWHLTWAISNVYRLGNDSVKVAIRDAYCDATRRAKEQKGIADRMVNGDKLYMGDAHSGGRAYAKKHVVVPGRKGYLQSYEEYIEKNRN